MKVSSFGIGLVIAAISLLTRIPTAAGFVSGLQPQPSQHHHHHHQRQPWRKSPLLQVALQSTRSSTVVKEELLEGEYALYLRGETPITTLTWFRGDAASATKILEDRLGRILDQNRWLGGELASEKTKVYLSFDPTEALNPGDFLTLLDRRQSPIRRQTPLERLARDCKQLLLQNGPTEPLFQVTVVPCRNSPKTHFAVLVALSHIVGDGHTYYKLMSMLCGGDDADESSDNIEPLIYERIATTANQQAEAMGKSNYDFFAKPGPAFFINYFGGLVKSRTFGPVNQCFFTLVDDEGMQAEKARVVTKSNGEVDFVSTNDVLTSWFLQTTKSDVGAMAINFRNRLSDHTDRHSGNYESIIIYGPKDSADPTLIRKSLDSFRRTETIQDPLPSFFKALGLSSGLITNWSSFAKPNCIPGCQEELHIPLYDAAPLVPSGTAVMIVFRAGPKGLGLFMAGSPDALLELGYSRQFRKRPPFLSTKPLL